MTTPSTERKAGPLLGTGAQTAWPFTFKVFAATDIAVTIADSLGVETALVYGVDFTVTLNANQETSPGGTVTYPISGSPLPVGKRLVIVGNLPYDQPLDLPSGGNFSPLALENQLDRLTMQIQQLRENVGRALQVSVSSGANIGLPAPSANELIGWDPTGQNLQNFAVSELATAVAYATMRYDTFTGDGAETQFTLTADPVTLANLDVAISGVTQTPGSDYSLASGVLVFASAPPNGAEILARYGEGLVNVGGDSSDIRFLPAGTGAAERTVQAKLRETVSVQDFGAVGDGVADDTDAIKAAVAASDSIYFPPGTYLVSETIYTRGAFDGTWYRGKKLFGAGVEATTIKAASGFTDQFVIHIGNKDYDPGSGNYVYCIQNELSDMTIAHENIPDTSFCAGVFMTGTWNNKISNLKIGVIAYPFTRWDLAIDKGTYTTIVENIHCQNLQAATAVIGDVTTIWFYGCSATFVNLVGCVAVGFDHLTVQGTYSGVYQYNRIQIEKCANVGFNNGDLEGDGRMFNISDSQSIVIENNNVALPGSFTKSGTPQKSMFMSVQNTVGVVSRDNVFMNWNQGPLGQGNYLTEPGLPNRNMQTCDFNGAFFTGASYYRNSVQSIPASTETIVNFAGTKYDSGTYVISSFVSSIFTYTPLVTLGTNWRFTAPLRAFYSVKASVVLTGLNTATESAFIAVHVGGVEVWRKWNSSANSAGLTTLEIAADVYADSTADIQIVVWQNGAGAVAIPTSATTNFVQISLINER